MATRTEEVAGGVVEALDALKPERGEVLVVRCRDIGPDTTRVLSEVLKEHGHKPAIFVVPGADVKLVDLTDEIVAVWGSDCTRCGNTTPGSQRCDQCNSTRYTRTLYVAKDDS